MILTVTCIAGFFIGFLTHIILRRWAKRRHLDLIRVDPRWHP